MRKFKVITVEMEAALEKTARLQTEFWEALTELEQETGLDVDSTRDLAGMTVEDLAEEED